MFGLWLWISSSEEIEYNIFTEHTKQAFNTKKLHITWKREERRRLYLGGIFYFYCRLSWADSRHGITASKIRNFDRHKTAIIYNHRFIMFSTQIFICLTGLKRKQPPDSTKEDNNSYSIGSLLSDPQVSKRRRFFPEFEPAEKPQFPHHSFSCHPPRRSAIDLLVRVFPKIKPSVLQLILQSCAGDLVQAIEEVLTKCNSKASMFPESSQWGRSTEEVLRDYRQLRANGLKYGRGEPFIGSGSKSAFTPISPLLKTHLANTSSSACPIPFALDPNRSKDNHNLPVSFFLDSRVAASALLTRSAASQGRGERQGRQEFSDRKDSIEETPAMEKAKWLSWSWNCEREGKNMASIICFVFNSKGGARTFLVAVRK